MERAARILVVDDERAIADLVASLLVAEGMEVRACYGAAQALQLLERERYDLGIFDIMMPGMDGFELCTRVRAVSDIPIVFLSAKDEEADLVVGFALGADDYVTKPFRPRELLARVKARLRRAERTAQGVGASPGVVEACGISVDVDAHTAHLHDLPLSLTPKEFSLLALLVGRAGQPVSTAELYEGAWEEPYDSAASNTVMVHIRHLRQKLAAVDSSSELIQTVWGVGYRVPAGSGRAGADAGHPAEGAPAAAGPSAGAAR